MKNKNKFWRRNSPGDHLGRTLKERWIHIKPSPHPLILTLMKRAGIMPVPSTQPNNKENLNNEVS